MSAPAWLQVTLFVVLALLTAAAVVGDAAWRVMMRRRKLSERQMLAHDARKAREHAHDLGLPWLESDGTLSWPPVKVTGEDVARARYLERVTARAMHAKRLRAQDYVEGGVVINGMPATPAEWNALTRENAGMTANSRADHLLRKASANRRPVDHATGVRSPLGSATWQDVPDASVIDTSSPDVSGD